MLLVSDVMTHSVVTLAPEMSLGDAAATLSTMGVSGAPVCDVEGHVVGVFSKSDVLKLDGSTAEGARVGALMTAKVASIRDSEPLKAAIEQMAAAGVHRLIVIGADGHLAGIITPMDVIKALASGKLAAPALDQTS